ncbi:MAG: hypothetical protein H7338_08145 [Candidatus Sericytochromatia bacterium]|nr:hypothetical protein [Candidatus Sericytochromatia bacterium]
MDLYIYADRQHIGSLMGCRLFADPRVGATDSGFVQGDWPGFAETPYADAETWATLDFILGNNETGDLYRRARIYPTTTIGETVTFWYGYIQTRAPKG